MAVVPIDHEYIKTIKPPVNHRGAIGWLKENLFDGIFNSILSILVLGLLIRFVPPFIQWAFINASWLGTSGACKAGDGACWAVVFKNFRFIIFGFYPHELHWRPFSAMMILFALLFFSNNKKYWSRALGYGWIAGLVSMAILMKGGIMGLAPVDSMKWGGLPLTLLLSVFGLTAAYPLGVILALGRVSNMPMIRYLSVGYIELIRGVPLISLLFMSSIIFPLFLPEGRDHQQHPPGPGGHYPFHGRLCGRSGQRRASGHVQRAIRGRRCLGTQLYQTMRLIILAPGIENCDSTHFECSGICIQGYVPGRDHSSLRFFDDLQNRDPKSGMDGVFNGNVPVCGPDVLFRMFFHVQFFKKT